MWSKDVHLTYESSVMFKISSNNELSSARTLIKNSAVPSIAFSTTRVARLYGYDSIIL